MTKKSKSKEHPSAKIKVIGIGGCGGNAISRMAENFPRGVDLIAINTDIQDLNFTNARKKIHIGKNLTKGLGTGMNPDLGRQAAEENRSEIVEALKGADMVFITAGEGGGCLRGDSLVLTNPKGPVKIDSIKPGDMVYTFDDGKLAKRKVLAAMKTGIKKVLELKTNNRTIYASEDHPFLKVKPLNSLSNNRFSKFIFEWTELNNLKNDDLVVALRELPDEKKTVNLPDGSYANEKFCQLFGFLLGDGWISCSKESWKIYFSPSKDEKKNQKYLDLIKEVFGLEMKKTPAANWYYGNSKKTYELLEQLGLKKKAPEKEISQWVFSLPKEQKKAFIIGLADADGNYSIQIGRSGLPKKEIKFEMSSEKLIKGLKVLCDSIGLRTSNVNSRTRFIKAPNSKEAKNNTSWILRIYRTHQLLGELTHPTARTGLSFVYPFRSERVSDFSEFFKFFGFNKIKSIKEIGDEEVYDITVDGSHNFIAEGFVVHNTGTGASPVIAEIAKELGILTIAIVTKPFSFEGAQRAFLAQEGITKLRERVDTLITVPNDRIFSVINKDTSLLKAFEAIDEILKNAVLGITELIMSPGIVNVDFADVKTIMSEAGSAIIGFGVAGGQERANRAANLAINSPLLEAAIDGAKGVLFSVSGHRDLKMNEINEVAKLISESVDQSAKIIFGAYHDRKLNKGQLKVTLVATGFNGDLSHKSNLLPSLFTSKIEDGEQVEEINPVNSTKLSYGVNIAGTDKKTEKSRKEKLEEIWETPAFLRKKKR